MTNATATKTANNSNSNEGIQAMQDLTKSEIKDRIKEYNETHNLSATDDNYVPVSGKKDELIERLSALDTELGPLAGGQTEEEEAQAANDEQEEVVETEGVEAIHEAAQFANVVNREYKSLKMSQIVQNPNNPREEEDYFDPSLQRKIVREKGITDALQVKPTGDTNSEGEDTFIVVDGNRRRFNLLYVLENTEEICESMGVEVPSELDVAPEDYEVHTIVREVEGNEAVVLFDEMAAIYNANESDLDLSPIGKMRLFKKALDAGATYEDIGERFELSKPYISKIMLLEEVPENIQRYVHFGFNAEHFGNVLNKEELKERNIPFIETDEGVKVVGITQNNAVELGALKRKAIKQADDDWSAEKVDHMFEDFIADCDKSWSYRNEGGEGVISAAMGMSTSQFKPWLLDAARNFGLLEQRGSSTSDDGEQERVGTASIDLDGGDDGSSKKQSTTTEKASEKASTTKAQAKEAKTSHAEMIEGLAADLETGDLVLSPTWERQFADDLRFENKDAIAALNYFLDNNILVEA